MLPLPPLPHGAEGRLRHVALALLRVRLRSLNENGMGDEGAKALAAVLPQTKITYLRCAPRFSCPSRRALQCLARLPSTASPSRAPHRREEGGLRLNCRVVCALAGTRHANALSRARAPSGSLERNNLTEEGERAIKAAAGAGVEVYC